LIQAARRWKVDCSDYSQLYCLYLQILSAARKRLPFAQCGTKRLSHFPHFAQANY
jgi:hypothetical protein